MKSSTGYHADTSRLRITSMTDSSPSMKPIKYAPPSPRKISPAGKFQIKKPITAPIMISEADSTIGSCTWKATYPSDANIMNATIDASPLKPSMMLMALASAATASTVTAHEMAAYDSRKSSDGTLMRVTAISSTKYASAAAIIVQTRRVSGETRLVKSSIRPDAKAGRPHATMPRMPPDTAG